MQKPIIDRDGTQELLDARFVHVFRLTYTDGTRYIDASRRGTDNLVAFMDDEQLDALLPDAVAAALVIAPLGSDPKIVLFHEYRYPTGQYLLSVPSGLIDAKDKDATEPLVEAMVREVKEECGITLVDGDTCKVINPLLYTSPGLTDESCALLEVVVRSEASDALSSAGTEGTERISDFSLFTKEEAKEILDAGRDPWGARFPFTTWAALTHFVYAM